MSRSAALILSFVVAAAAVAGASRVQAPDAEAVRVFVERTAAYAGRYHAATPRKTGLTREPAGPVETAASLQSRIRRDRSGVRQGWLFEPAVAAIVRKRIAAALTPEDMAALLDEREPGPGPKLTVNAPWPEGATFDFVPPRLITALPTLPRELQYRLVGRTLVLWDHRADLIVDFLPGALET